MSIKLKDFDSLLCVLPLFSYLLVSFNGNLHQNKPYQLLQIYFHRFDPRSPPSSLSVNPGTTVAYIKNDFLSNSLKQLSL